MATKETPVAAVKRLHGTKEKLVSALVGPLSEGNKDADQDAVRARLMTASNQKLLHLSNVVAEVKKRFGGRSQMIDALAKTQKSDKDYLSKLETVPLPKLLDLARAQARRNKASATR
jgi:hypothetical protein